MESQKFLELIEKIRSNEYAESKLDLYINEFDEARFVDRLSDEQGVILAEALKHNTHITEINLDGNQTQDAAAIALAKVETIQNLNLAGTPVTVGGLITVAKSNLKSLTVWLGEEEDLLENQRFMKALTENRTIETLNILYGCLESDWVTELIAGNTTINSLGLHYIDDEYLKSISHNKTLKKLRIDRSHLTDEGAMYLAGSTSIESLVIGTSDIGDKGAAVLTSLPALKSLDIYGRNITAEGAKVFIHSKLKELDVYGSPYNKAMSLEDARQINLAFRDVRDDNGEVQYTKKVKLDNQENYTDDSFVELPLLGEIEGNLDDSGYSSQLE